MKTTTLAVLNASLLVAASVLLLPVATTSAWPTSPVAQDGKAAAPKTEDVIHMSDGRVLHGQIISETRDQIVFEYRDSKLNMTTKLTLKTEDIAQIDRDVPLEGAADEKPTEDAPAADKPATDAGTTATTGTTKGFAATNAKTSRMQTNDPSVKSIYYLPMNGQMSTDVNSEAYINVVKDIKEKKPDVLVISMNCEDMDDTLFALLNEPKPEEFGVLDFDEMRKLVTLFQKDLRDVRQVLWVQNSVGISTNAALSWKELYMTPSARLGGMSMVLSQSGAKGWQDSDVRAKMMAAWTGISKSFLEFSGRSLALADAMMDPEYSLSVSWKGRTAQWFLDESGEYIVDADDERPANFYAKHAEDFGVSNGTAETMDDLAMLLGYREYRIVDGAGEKMIEDYIKNWRRALADCEKNFQEYQKFRGWATGEDTLKYLGRAKSCLEDILNAIERYKAVEVRLARMGANKIDIKILIEQLQEQIRALKDRGGAGGGGGGRAGGRGRAGGGGSESPG